MGPILPAPLVRKMGRGPLGEESRPVLPALQPSWLLTFQGPRGTAFCVLPSSVSCNQQERGDSGLTPCWPKIEARKVLF